MPAPITPSPFRATEYDTPAFPFQPLSLTRTFTRTTSRSAATPKNCRSPSAAKPRTPCPGPRGPKHSPDPAAEEFRLPVRPSALGGVALLVRLHPLRSPWLCDRVPCRTPQKPTVLPTSRPRGPKGPLRGQPGLAWMDPSLGDKAVSASSFAPVARSHPYDAMPPSLRDPRSKSPARKHFRGPPPNPR